MYRLRAATAADIDFLTDVVIEATRDQGRLPPYFDEAEYRAGFAEWTAEHIAEHDGASLTSVIDVGGRPIGRLRVVRTEDELELAGIQLLPSEQSAGIGSRIIADLFAEATAAGKPMTLSVEKDNERARLLYERLGFTVAGQTDEEFVMRRVPPSAHQPTVTPGITP